MRTSIPLVMRARGPALFPVLALITVLAALVVLAACAGSDTPGTGLPGVPPSSEPAPGDADALSPSDVIELPSPDTTGSVALELALSRRRSLRSFADKELELADIGQLMWAAQGVTNLRTGGRTAPSAGALYPIELVVADRKGAWRYLPAEHALVRVAERDPRKSLAAAAAGQSWIAGAPIVVAVLGVEDRTAGKYGSRAERYVALEAGHVCQNILLQATALGLGACPVGAFNDGDVRDVLGMPADHQPYYLVPVGRP